MAGIKYDGGLPYQYITEDLVNGNLTISVPNNIYLTAVRDIFQDARINYIAYNAPGGASNFNNNGTSAGQQATPILLSDVIAILQAYGFCS